MKTILTLRRETLTSPIGEIVILTDDQGSLRALDFADYHERTTRLLNRHYGRGGWEVVDAKAPTVVLAAVQAYLAGDIGALDTLRTATGGTPFQREVWAALRATPPGAPQSYGALAARIGRPSAVRAVGMANGQNPIAIVAACHRIVGANGSLTGYAGGMERKQWLLDHEARHTR